VVSHGLEGAGALEGPEQAGPFIVATTAPAGGECGCFLVVAGTVACIEIGLVPGLAPGATGHKRGHQEADKQPGDPRFGLGTIPL